MIDRTTFVICLIKLIGLQIILFGVFFGVLHNAPIFQILICIGSLVFAVGSNILLAINIRAYKKLKNGGAKNEQAKTSPIRETFVSSDQQHIPGR